MTTIRAFLLGAREFRLQATACTTQPGAYDAGREFAHRATLRRWDTNR